MILLRAAGTEAVSTKIILPNYKPARETKVPVQVTGVGCLGEEGGEQSFLANVTSPSILPVRDLTKSKCPSLACASVPGYFFLGTLASPVSSTWFFLSKSLHALLPLPGMPPPTWWSLTWPPSHTSCFCAGGPVWTGALRLRSRLLGLS